MSKLSFNDFKHEYLLDGKPVPSVTRVISNVTEDMMLNSSFIRAGARGTAVHKVCEFINTGVEVNYKALSEDVKPYVDGYLAFMKKGTHQIVHSEKKLYSEKYRYAGTADIIGTNKRGKLCVMDIKTSAVVSPTTSLQLAAYEFAYKEMNSISSGVKFDRVCIWLTGDGKYKLIPYNGPGDFNIFLSHLAVFNWRKTHGL